MNICGFLIHNHGASPGRPEPTLATSPRPTRRRRGRGKRTSSPSRSVTNCGEAFNIASKFRQSQSGASRWPGPAASPAARPVTDLRHPGPRPPRCTAATLGSPTQSSTSPRLTAGGQPAGNARLVLAGARRWPGRRAAAPAPSPPPTPGRRPPQRPQSHPPPLGTHRIGLTRIIMR
jgi:hypothetical protein